MGEMSWTVAMGMDVKAFRAFSEGLCENLPGTTVEVELEEVDCMTAFFEVEQADGEPLTLEVSVYDMGRDGRILSVEEESSDNGSHWDDACQLGEALAALMDGDLLE
jgi:hypothetical protein